MPDSFTRPATANKIDMNDKKANVASGYPRGLSFT